MINENVIDFVSEKLKINRRDLIEKDIIITNILFYLGSNKDFFHNYAFKGGTCLIKCYLGYYRFSEDLDFTYINQSAFERKSGKQIRKLISSKIDKISIVLEEIAKLLDLKFVLDKDNKKYFEFGGNNTFVTLKLWYNSKVLDKETFIKIQINYREKLSYGLKELKVNSIIQQPLKKDFSFLFPEESKFLFSSIKIKTYSMEEILIEKIRAILTRRGVKARDIVDVHLIQKEKKINLKNIRKSVVEKTIFMLRYEKYIQNIKDKSEWLADKEIVLGKEETLLLKPLPENFNKFVEELKPFLKEITAEILEKFEDDKE